MCTAAVLAPAARLTLRDGRTLAYAVYGDPAGLPVFLFHGTPGSRLDVEPITTLGRAPTNTIALESNFVSTEHTRILYRDRSLWVEDMGSRNGTFVDQRQVQQPVAVVPGSILQVGDVRFKFAV